MKKLLLIFLILINVNVYAQYIKSDGLVSNWVDLGFGVYEQIDETVGVAFNFGLNQKRNDNIFRLRFNLTNEFILFTTPSQYTFSNGFLFGKNINMNRVDLYIMGGVGYVIGLSRGDILTISGSPFFPTITYQKDYYLIPSIPLEVDIRYAPFKDVGMSLSVFGEINSYSSMVGILTKINLGNLR